MAIDPGSKGYVAMQVDGEFKFFAVADYDILALATEFKSIRERHDDIVCVIEDVHAIHGSSAASTFTFGFNKGYLIGLLAASRIPYVLVQPKEWQKAMWCNSDIVYATRHSMSKTGKVITRKPVDTKNTSINAARRLFPNIDFRKSERSKSVDDNKVDATLMCEYARRMNL